MTAETSLNILVAMSGGVDSSVAAALLHEQGHRVIGVTLRLLEKETGFGCCGSTRDIEDARAVCAQLGIPHYVMDFSKTFGENIMDPFVRTYLRGETPNPCIACNRFVKFDALLQRAKALGADKVATGHYARVAETPSPGLRPPSPAAAGEGNTIYRLLRAADRGKDQSYVLHNLGQEQLAHLCFPIGDLMKAEVRDLARRFGLKTADKRDSQEICFVPGADTAAYIRDKAKDYVGTSGASRLPQGNEKTLEPGAIEDGFGKRLGTHKGVAFYTRGQREGLGLSLGRPVYVVDLIPETNTVIVGEDNETFSSSCFVRDLHWTRGTSPADEFEALVQIRSRHEAAPCRVRVAAGGAEVVFQEAQRAVSPGQSAVFYRGDEVWGGGIIKTARLLGDRAGARRVQAG
jgi:tRNA-uridine 2-sulfurtransferase